MANQVQDLTPEDVSRGIADGRYLLVDVREPNEVATEAYPGGVVVPLSTFDPKRIPDPKGMQVVFACRSGKRSVTASLAAQAAGLPYDKHLAGGILGWKAAGLPTRTGSGRGGGTPGSSTAPDQSPQCFRLRRMLGK